jgi:uncharacterized OB-fold protein
MFWRFNADVYRLVAMKCVDCKHITYPRGKICPQCGSWNVKDYKLPKTGTVHTYTINWTPPPNLEPPIVNVIVDLDGGGRYQGLITECADSEKIKIGTRLEMVLRKTMTDRGLRIYGYKFRLVGGE